MAEGLVSDEPLWHLPLWSGFLEASLGLCFSVSLPMTVGVHSRLPLCFGVSSETALLLAVCAFVHEIHVGGLGIRTKLPR